MNSEGASIKGSIFPAFLHERQKRSPRSGQTLRVHKCDTTLRGRAFLRWKNQCDYARFSWICYQSLVRGSPSNVAVCVIQRLLIIWEGTYPAAEWVTFTQLRSLQRYHFWGLRNVPDISTWRNVRMYSIESSGILDFILSSRFTASKAMARLAKARRAL